MSGDGRRVVRSTLRVSHESASPDGPGPAGPRQRYRTLVGAADQPTDRVRLGRASYEPGTVEQLHWHPIEALYYVISGHATVRDVEGRAHEVGAGSVVYAPAGLAGAHQWEVHESLELLDIRATNDPSRKLQLTVDRETMRSSIELEELERREGFSFPSRY